MKNSNNHQRITVPVSDHHWWLLGGAIFLAVVAGIVAGALGGEIALLILATVAFMVLALSDFRYGIVIAIVLLPLSATQLFPRQMFGIIGFNPFNVALLFSVVALFLVLAFQDKKLVLPRWPRHLGIYIGLLFLATLHGATHLSEIPIGYKLLNVINFDGVGGYIRDVFVKPILFLVTAWMVAIAVKNTDRPVRYLVPLFGAALIMPIVVIARVVMSGASLSMLASPSARGFLSFTGMHANELGLMFNMELALVLFTFFSVSNKLAKWLLGGMAVLLVIAIALTFSRGAFLGFLVVVGYFLYVQKRFGIMIAGILLLPLSIFLIPQAVIDRATTGVDNNNVAAISAGRVHDIWAPLIPTMLSNVLIGNGQSSILWSEPAHSNPAFISGRYGHPHSAYIGVLLDTGIVGLFIVFLFFRHVWRLFSSLVHAPPAPVWHGFFQGAGVCILLLLVQGLTDDRFSPTAAQTFLWLAYGMALGLASQQTAEARAVPKKFK